MPRDELPPLDKFVVQSYAESDTAYPVVVVNRDSRAAGYVKPSALAACPDPLYAATHVFTGIQPTTVDARVLWVYERLPGPELSRLSYDEETGAAMTTYTQRVLRSGATPRALTTSDGTRYNLQEVVDSYVEPVDSIVATLVTVAMTIPATIVEYKSVGFQFPALFTFITGWTIPPLCTIPGPYPGVTHDLTKARTASKPAEVTTSFSRALPSVSETWTVTSPGSADRFFGIGENTIHNAILIEETCGAGTHDIEDLPASTPSSYSVTDELLIQTSAVKWKGNIFKKTEVTVIENPA